MVMMMGGDGDIHTVREPARLGHLLIYAAASDAAAGVALAVVAAAANSGIGKGVNTTRLLCDMYAKRLRCDANGVTHRRTHARIIIITMLINVC